MPELAILGAGMAGFGAAHRLFEEGMSPVVYEKESYHGGHTASFRYPEGFVFDDGPHISFTKDGRIQSLFAESVGEYEVLDARANNYWKGRWIKHPAQCNLYGLPTDLVVKILCDFIENQRPQEPPPCNYAEWLIASFGKTFAETFPMEYGRKYHTTSAENMTTDWLGPRLYRPKLEEVLRGALSPETPDVHYVGNFRYPSRGGFVSFLDLFLRQTRPRLGHELVKLDPRVRLLFFSNGVVTGYDHVISTLPLPELIPRIVDAPPDVVSAARRLSFTSCVVVNVGVNRPDLSEAHWTYFYDRDVFFTRVSFPHMLSPNNVPPGAGSLQAEVYFSPNYRPLDRAPEACIDPVLRDLERCGVLRADDEILFRGARLVPYANVIFDHDRAEALDVVHGFLDDVEVGYAGRYGEWGYHWTDESFRSGEKAAEGVLDRLCSRRRTAG